MIHRSSPRYIPKDLINKSIDEIKNVFGSDWLTLEKGDHPLQILWNRADTLATHSKLNDVFPKKLLKFGCNLIKIVDNLSKEK